MNRPLTLIQHISYVWRLFATAVSFSTFAIGGIISYVVYPVLIMLPITLEEKQALGRRFIHLLFKFFISLMRVLRVFTYEFHGAELLKEKGQLIVANHPSLIDVCFLLSRTPESNCIVRGGLSRNPFTKAPIRTADFIVNENPEQLIADCAQTLQNGNSLIIFPEGTRTTANQPMVFKKGTANIALRSGVDLRPVTITCRPPTLQKGVKWYSIPRIRPHFVLRVQETFLVRPYLDNGHTISVNARRLTQDLHDFITEKLAEH